MRFAALIFIYCLIIAPQHLSAQFKNNEKNTIDFPSLLVSGNKNAASLSRLLGIDPNRLHMSQSYQMSYGLVGGHSLSQGIYLNTLRYDFNIPLKLQLQWGVAHNPLQASGIKSPLQSGLFLSGASLEYKPTENMKLELGISSYPQHDFYYSPFSIQRD
ncbi:MAG: hypothetical protein H6696_11130 [Deferribacteres bacterium]|nr:hypothetical protein [candidate division KSB1 bacterium]MCB9502485.1 hypothetical protein [Deferribacteres bacterium]